MTMSKKVGAPFLNPTSKIRWTMEPLLGGIERKFKRLVRLPVNPLKRLAAKSWEVAPSSILTTMPAYYLSHHLERVTGRAYAYHWADDGAEESLPYEMAGGIERYQAPTMAYLIKEVFLIDGAFYKAGSIDRVYPRSRGGLSLHAKQEIERAAVQCTIDGNMFFGLWLQDDCVLYPLAKEEGLPISTAQPVSSHKAAYETLLDMQVTRVDSAFFRELVIFDDRLQNRSKHDRFLKIRDKLQVFYPSEPHPGVFIIRGDSGKKRRLINEAEVAEHMRRYFGFRVVDVTKDDVPKILSACAGAQILMGVEGSHLVHGLMVLGPGKAVFVLQPPFRFCSVIKRTTDRDGQYFCFVVGHPESDGFRIDLGEVEQTLKLLPKLDSASKRKENL
jgi:hypothetical protein